MAINLETLVPSLKREVNPPGSDFFPESTDDEWVGHLQDAFWEARLKGALAGYQEGNGLITPDMPRELQQLVVLFAAYRIVFAALLNVKTVFRAQSGPVEFETQQSANVLRELLTSLRDKITIVIDNLGSQDLANIAYFDAVIAREDSLILGDTWWVR